MHGGCNEWEGRSKDYELLFFSFLLMQILTRRSVLTCSDIALLGYFDTEHSNGPCHSLAGEEGDEAALIRTTFRGHPALLCCHGCGLLDGEDMPIHAEDYPSA